MAEQTNYFAQLYAVNVQDKTEKKGNLTYLSWTWAWAEIKKLHPDATYTVYENADGLNYHTDGKTCWVKTGVTINGIEHIEYLPVMNNRNISIPLKDVTSMDVNKAIQRSITKACARHGLGLYIYAGEDLPETDGSGEKQPSKPNQNAKASGAQKPAASKTSDQSKPRLAAEGQKLFIIENLPQRHLDRLIEKYGVNLDGFTYEDAAKTIASIQKGMNGNG